MKPNPAFFVLTVLAGCTIAFLWAVTPKTTPEEPSEFQQTHPQYSDEQVGLSQAQKSRVAGFAKNWAKTPTYEADFNALDPSYKVASITNSLFDPSDEYWGLPRDGKGSFELVDAYCTACHSLSIVMQQRATPERWQELLVWMEEKQGMSKLPTEDEVLVINYVSTYFSTNETE